MVRLPTDENRPAHLESYRVREIDGVKPQSFVPIGGRRGDSPQKGRDAKPSIARAHLWRHNVPLGEEKLHRKDPKSAKTGDQPASLRAFRSEKVNRLPDSSGIGGAHAMVVLRVTSFANDNPSVHSAIYSF